MTLNESVKLIELYNGSVMTYKENRWCRVHATEYPFGVFLQAGYAGYPFDYQEEHPNIESALDSLSEFAPIENWIEGGF